MTRRVAVVGSTSFPMDAKVGAEVVDLMRAAGEDVVFLTRGSEGFDRFVIRVAELLEKPCVVFPSKGGADNFRRDIDLVSDADEVLAFFDPERLDAGSESGTSHIVGVALNRNKPVRAFSAVGSQLVYAGDSA